MSNGLDGARVFKTAWFAKACRKARLSDDELLEAIEAVLRGQADALGGGVYKKRLGKNDYRSIIVARARSHWFYVYLFAKKDRANIDESELNAFRKLAKQYERVSPDELEALAQAGDILEIGHGNQD